MPHLTHNPPTTDKPHGTAMDPSLQLLTAKQVASLLGVRAKRVYELGIPYLHLSPRSIRWRQQDVRAWIEEATLTTKAA